MKLAKIFSGKKIVYLIVDYLFMEKIVYIFLLKHFIDNFNLSWNFWIVSIKRNILCIFDYRYFNNLICNKAAIIDNIIDNSIFKYF